MLGAGWAPYIPHLSFYWHTLYPHDYEVWMKLDLSWIERCDVLLRLPGLSKGADREVEHAIKLGVPVYGSAIVPSVVSIANLIRQWGKTT